MSSRRAYIFLPVLIVVLLINYSNAQVFLNDEVGYDSISERILLKKEYTGGIIAHNLGFGVNFRLGRNCCAEEQEHDHKNDFEFFHHNTSPG